MLKLVEQVMGEVVQSDRTPTVSQAEMQSLFGQVCNHCNRQVHIVQLRIYCSHPETMDKLGDRAVDEPHLRDIERASTKTAGTDPFIEHHPRPSKGIEETFRILVTQKISSQPSSPSWLFLPEFS